MSTVHYFQRYSQRENTATNNTLLLFSRLYHSSPNKFYIFLNSLLDGYDIEGGIQFKQQIKGEGSVPDASLLQVSFKIVIETKMHKGFSIHQITEHLKSFGTEQYQVLISLSPKPPDRPFKNQIESKVGEFNSAKNKSIRFLPITFQDIVIKFRDNLENYEYELNEIIDDFESYCINDGLITNDEARLRVVPCSWTLEENFDFSLYYDSADRGYSDHSYLGIYANKAVRGIGKIENIVRADLKLSGKLDIIDSKSPVTEHQQQNILNVISAAKSNNNWDISKGYNFFCVEKFYETNYRKTTKYPLQGTKFFDLKNRLDVTSLPTTEKIAQLLMKKEW
jgi:hypothetical protein